MRNLILTSTVALTLACTAAQQPPAIAPEATAVPSATAIARNPDFRNVQVLSHEMSREQLIEVMRRFTQALGVRCDHCHLVTATTPEQEFDFPSDAKEPKRIARVMIQMSQQINGPWLDRVEAIEGHAGDASAETQPGSAPPRVSCWTCHRGKTEPEMPPPLPPLG